MNAQHMTGLLGEISEAYQALQNVPVLEARIRELEAKLIIDGQTIAHREERIHHLKQEMDALYGKLRSVEAERDDAGFRLLETEDKLDAIKSVVKTLFHDAGEVLKAVEPPKPVPVPEPIVAPVVELSTGTDTNTTVPPVTEANVEVAPLPTASTGTATPSPFASSDTVTPSGGAHSPGSVSPFGSPSASEQSHGTTAGAEVSKDPDIDRPFWQYASQY